MGTVLFNQITNAKFCVGDLLKADSCKIGEHGVKICLRRTMYVDGEDWRVNGTD